MSVLGTMVYYRYFLIENFVVKKSVEQSQYISAMYKSHVLRENIPALTKLQTRPYTELVQDPDFIKFTKDSLAFFDIIQAQKILLHDNFGNAFLESNTLSITEDKQNGWSLNFQSLRNYLDKYFLQKYQSTSGLKLAYMGENTNHIILNGVSFNDLNAEASTGKFLESYIILNRLDNYNLKINLVLKITDDITDEWSEMNLLEERVIITFIIIFLIFFFIVLFNTNYAQKIIDQERQTQRDLQAAKVKAESENVAKSEFLANVSHELRTPLNAIIGFSEIILSSARDQINEKHYGYIQDIYNSGKHLLAVINDILDFSKALADKLTIDNIEVDLNKIASSSLRFVQTRADEAKIKLIEKLPQQRIIIKADAKRLKQALLNLLSNAVKFTPQDHSVILEIKPDNVKNLVFIRVIDSGIGIAEKDIPQAMSSFGQVDNKLSRKYEGTGLGLPLTKKLVELMQGKFNIQSKVGQGTTVTLTFSYDKNFKEF